MTVTIVQQLTGLKRLCTCRRTEKFASKGKPRNIASRLFVNYKNDWHWRQMNSRLSWNQTVTLWLVLLMPIFHVSVSSATQRNKRKTLQRQLLNQINDVVLSAGTLWSAAMLTVSVSRNILSSESTLLRVQPLPGNSFINWNARYTLQFMQTFDKILFSLMNFTFPDNSDVIGDLKPTSRKRKHLNKKRLKNFTRKL